MSRQDVRIAALQKLAPITALAALFVALAAWSWRRWPDLLVDFGQQLYIPWRLAAGERLHQEITLLHGPLSQYLNALWFTLFGPSLTVLIIVNLAILALLTWLVYRIVRLVGSPLTATISCVVLLSLFGFSQYVKNGNYNFIAPYTHESTHGLVLAAGMILALARAMTAGGRRSWAIAGICLGLACLTKVDVALAAMASAAVGLTSAALMRELRAGRLLWFASGACAPAAAFLGYFLTYLSPGRALRAVGGGFAALSAEVARNPFYLGAAGLDDPLGNLWLMIVMAGVLIGLVLLGVAADAVARKRAREPAAVALAAGALLFLGLMLKPELLPWEELPRALPLITLAAGVSLLVLYWRVRGDASRRQVLIPGLLGTSFALALVAKTALNLHVYHYGFYLALPATLVLVVISLEGIPRLLRDRFGCGIVFRSLAVALLAVCTVYHLRWSREVYGMKDYPVGRDGDRIVTFSPAYDDAGPIVAEALAWLEAHTTSEQSIVGFPEGIMLNYLARRPTRTTCMNFMMTEMILFGEQELLDALRADPPDYVLLVHKDTAEFGVGWFGQDRRYGQAIMDWVKHGYEAVAQFGAEPLRDRRFGIRIMKRADAI
ncbi:MAG TPA: glycosyltransferase family 39 protein [Candidatus Polarisedimenticolia bacterium]|nr:glycosyltransferase family 39 protein [Candidatus Polarisedimenticolia bacterium]